MLSHAAQYEVRAELERLVRERDAIEAKITGIRALLGEPYVTHGSMAGVQVHVSPTAAAPTPVPVSIQLPAPTLANLTVFGLKDGESFRGMLRRYVEKNPGDTYQHIAKVLESLGYRVSGKLTLKERVMLETRRMAKQGIFDLREGRLYMTA